MRIPVFARRANPSADRPILRKSISYASLQVDSGKADWIDRAHPEKGIICREMLYFGRRALPVETVEVSVDAGFVFGLKYVPPMMEKNPTLPRVQIDPLQIAVPNWDWSQEQATA